jgi:hypothetical protein
MSKITKVSEENEKFLSELNLQKQDIARFYNMKPHNFTTSTAKNKKINALRLFYLELKSREL